MAGGLRTDDTDGRLKFQYSVFMVTPNGPVKGGDFAECDHPRGKVDSVERPSAGKNYKAKKPGMVKWEPIKAKRCLPSDKADLKVYNWFRAAADPETGKAVPRNLLVRDVVIVHYNDLGVAIERWTLKNAWISEIGGEKMEASSEYQYEEMTIEYDYAVRRAG